MKKGYIFSWYNSGRNYGQTLQAYALQKIVNDMGHSVAHVCFDTNRSISNSIIRKIKDYKNLNMQQRETQKKFDLFIQNNMKTTECLKNDVDVKKFIKKQQPDFLICGSDQVWNPFNVHPFYYLAEIGESNTKRIAYAVSTCDKRRKEKFLEFPQIKDWIRQIDALFVRESSGKEILEELYGVDSKVVLDPTLLMSGKKWIELLNLKEKKNDYILCYAFNLTKEQKEVINKRAEQFGCPVKYGNVLVGKDVKKESWSPIDFLEAILNAKEVYTDSFHGTVFSILFHKNFIVFDNGNDINSDPYYNIDRMKTLLSLVNLNDRLVMNNSCVNFKEIDYSKVDRVLEERRNECISLLKRSME